MAFKDTKLKVLDNTGILQIKCLHVFKTKLIKPGSILTGVIKKIQPHKKLKKGQICKVIVVRCAIFNKRTFGLFLKDSINAVVLLKKTEFMPIGTRIFGPICYELRNVFLVKLLTLSSYLLQFHVKKIFKFRSLFKRYIIV